MRKMEFNQILRDIEKEIGFTEKQANNNSGAIWRTSSKGNQYLRFGYYTRTATKEIAEKIVNAEAFKKLNCNYKIQQINDSFSGQTVYRIFLLDFIII